MTSKVFAIGLGIKEGPIVRYVKAFTHTDSNDVPVKDFLCILREHLEYAYGSAVIDMKGVDINALNQVFIETNHSGAAGFAEQAIKQKKRENAIICIMETNAPPTCLEESYLVMELFSAGTLNALDPEQRNPLTQVFAGLPTIPMSAGGVIKAHMEAHDKFPSWLMFNDPGTNRFAPTSFARYGAHFGSGNTLMMGVAVNFGVSIGDDNLLDGHSSIASCVQMGDRNKVGSFVSMEGVLSPVNADPVVVGDDNFFGTRARVGTGLIIGNKNFWGSGVDVSMGTKLKDVREGSQTIGQYVNAGTPEGIQGADKTMITTNSAVRTVNGIEVLPGEFLLNLNTEENQTRFGRNDDLNANN
jgi:acetyltransferase-like isoleucine patch superfamily enzyme